jgi:hypothetical protein
MRAYFKNMLQAYRGTCDGLVYYYNPRLQRIIVRPHVKPRPSVQTRRFAAIAKKLKALAPSEAFKTDMTVYTDIYNRRLGSKSRPEHILSNWYNAFMKMMYALQASDPGIDLEFLERIHIENNDLPCRSVKRAVEAGLLEPVPGYELLDKMM